MELELSQLSSPKCCSKRASPQSMFSSTSFHDNFEELEPIDEESDHFYTQDQDELFWESSQKGPMAIENSNSLYSKDTLSGTNSPGGSEDSFVHLTTFGETPPAQVSIPNTPRKGRKTLRNFAQQMELKLSKLSSPKYLSNPVSPRSMSSSTSFHDTFEELEPIDEESDHFYTQDQDELFWESSQKGPMAIENSNSLYSKDTLSGTNSPGGSEDSFVHLTTFGETPPAQISIPNTPRKGRKTLRNFAQQMELKLSKLSSPKYLNNPVSPRSMSSSTSFHELETFEELEPIEEESELVQTQQFIGTLGDDLLTHKSQNFQNSNSLNRNDPDRSDSFIQPLVGTCPQTQNSAENNHRTGNLKTTPRDLGSMELKQSQLSSPKFLSIPVKIECGQQKKGQDSNSPTRRYFASDDYSELRLHSSLQPKINSSQKTRHCFKRVNSVSNSQKSGSITNNVRLENTADSPKNGFIPSFPNSMSVTCFQVENPRRNYDSSRSSSEPATVGQEEQQLRSQLQSTKFRLEKNSEDMTEAFEEVKSAPQVTQSLNKIKVVKNSKVVQSSPLSRSIFYPWIKTC